MDGQDAWRRLRTSFLHSVAAPLVGSRPAGSPATAGMTRGDGPALRRSVRGARWPLGHPDVGDAWPWLRLQRALGSSGDGSATAAIGKAPVAPVARLSGDANGCLHYPPADT
ncbi:uncharacterized protein TrAtP1_000240 [Trichoderma atroviride]|uniref:uncharacterized protein n=1 Tax=Hypocrea atroviridis TaxID=63577 RepID=UPI003331CD3D|nr:hypothetical protein TrAtP1_000240 [Trichoderma atroviride]